MNAWQIAGLVVIVGALALLVGAAIGYWTASTDLDREKGQAWHAGFREGFGAHPGSIVAVPPYASAPEVIETLTGAPIHGTIILPDEDQERS